MRVCIVSPHLDDAVLSCGVLMQRCVASSDDVFCLSIFTAGAGSEMRKREDRLVMARIGAEALHLDELDAPDRDPVYRSGGQLFFGALDPADPSIARIEGVVRGFLQQNRIEIAYFPLAAGTHIDHRIAHEVGRRIKDTQVRFYEDRPYILWPGILQSRMTELGVDADLPRVTEREMAKSVDSFHYLRYFLPGGALREQALSLSLAALSRPSDRRVAATSEELVATDDELIVLYEWLALYESQMRYIYPDYQTFLDNSVRYERAMSGRDAYVERSWKLAL